MQRKTCLSCRHWLSTDGEGCPIKRQKRCRDWSGDYGDKVVKLWLWEGIE